MGSEGYMGNVGLKGFGAGREDTMCKRTIRLVALLGSLIWLAGAQTQAQTNQQRVPLLMSKMPPQQSVAYKALKVVADNPTI